MAAIAVRDLRKVYDGKAAVDGLNLTVPRGSFFGFLGPNGAGKSTTIRMLTGLIPADFGIDRTAGVAARRQRMAIKQRIGLVPDESLLFDRLTGAEFLEFVGACIAWRVRSRNSGRRNCWNFSNWRTSAGS